MINDEVGFYSQYRSGRARIHQLLCERSGTLPVWVRAPARGQEFYSGFTRAKLYELNAKGLIRSVSIREPGQIKGTRLFNLQSILNFIESRADAAAKGGQ